MNKTVKYFVFPANEAKRHDGVVVLNAVGLKHAKAVAEDQGYVVGKGSLVSYEAYKAMDMKGYTILTSYALEY